MPITPTKDERRRVYGWLGQSLPSPLAQAFQDRGLALISVTLAQLRDPPTIASLAAAFISTDSKKLSLIRRQLEAILPTILDYGCEVVVMADPNEQPYLTQCANDLKIFATGTFLNRNQVWSLRAIAGEPSHPVVHFYQKGSPWHPILNRLEQPNPEPPANVGLKVACSGIKKAVARRLESATDSYGILLRRAFVDCSRVDLFQLGGGRSGALVFRAYAQSQLSGWPRPLFVKIDKRSDILMEYESYIERVHPFIPFHLGPQLRQSRCNVGGSNGIIVGDYVQESESLVQAAREGRAGAAIGCLFDRTLDNWYGDAAPEDEYLTRWLKLPHAAKFAPSRIRKAKKLGAKASPDDLSKWFIQKCKTKPVRIAKIHGDLHVENVRVRQGDAIVIDFKASRGGPLLRDIACLEVSLLVDGLDGLGSKRFSIGRWMRAVGSLYSRKFQISPEHTGPRDSSAWFYSCVRQLRLFARRAECVEGQYRAALVAALLHKATKDPKDNSPRSDRLAAAYVFAERMLKGAK